LAQRSRKRGQHARPETDADSPPPPAPDHRVARAPDGEPSPPPAPDPGIGRGRIPREAYQQQSPPAHYPQASRSEARNAEVRAALAPLAPGERPRVLVASVLVAALVGLVNLIAYAAGDTIGGKRPGAAPIVVFSAVMVGLAIGMWRRWYGAVLGFMALLAIVATLFALLLIEASNISGLIVALVIIVGCGYLFFKLVRVLSRIQMPHSDDRR